MNVIACKTTDLLNALQKKDLSSLFHLWKRGTVLTHKALSEFLKNVRQKGVSLKTCAPPPLPYWKMPNTD